MRITQGTFSFLPDLSDAQIISQIDYCLAKGWAVGMDSEIEGEARPGGHHLHPAISSHVKLGLPKL